MHTFSFPGLGLEFTLDRVAFTLFGHNIYWYGVIIALGFLLAVLYCCKISPGSAWTATASLICSFLPCPCPLWGRVPTT